MHGTRLADEPAPELLEDAIYLDQCTPEPVRVLGVVRPVETVIDERIPVTSEDAYKMCARLARAGFFVGQSSGAYMVGVERIARRERAGRFVTLFNDLGERYFSTRLWD